MLIPAIGVVYKGYWVSGKWGELVMDADKAIGLALAIYVIAAIFPAALSTFFDANTTGWDTGTVALWGLLPLLAVIFLIRRMGKGDAA